MDQKKTIRNVFRQNNKSQNKTIPNSVMNSAAKGHFLPSRVTSGDVNMFDLESDVSSSYDKAVTPFIKGSCYKDKRPCFKLPKRHETGRGRSITPISLRIENSQSAMTNPSRLKTN